MSALEWAWAAGLFEGEGSLVPRGNGRILVTLSMRDRDVVERFEQVLGCGTVHETRSGRNNPLWRYDLHRAADVLRVIRRMRPYLGERRGARADELVPLLEARVAEATRERPCATCGTTFSPPFDGNSVGRRFCTSRCMHAWHNKHRGRVPT